MGTVVGRAKGAIAGDRAFGWDMVDGEVVGAQGSQ